MSALSPFAVANFFLEVAKEEGRHITPMQLLKMVYIAHGWHLGLTGKPLISEDVQAWKYGPVIESIYHAFKGFRDKPITHSVSPTKIEHGSSLEPFLRRVWDVYSKYSGGQLSTMTHAAGTPWSQVYKPDILGLIIPNNVIEAHYKKKLNERPSRTNSN